MTEKQNPIAMAPEPIIEKQRRISSLWLLPLLAVLIGGYLLWRHYQQADIPVQIAFSSGEGLEAGKTQVRYQGFNLGVVESLELKENLQGVVATVKMRRRAEPLLRSGTRFWVVKPEITLAGASGLDTLFSGNYITLHPGEGAEQTRFTALNQAPPLGQYQDGLLVELVTENLGSLHVGSPILYREIQVGSVGHYELTPNNAQVLIKARIEPEYAYLIQANSRFWNVSGVQVKGTLPNIDINVPSFASLIAGGISFDTPDNGSSMPYDPDADPFILYPDSDAAQVAVEVAIRFPFDRKVIPNQTTIKFKGNTVGKVTEVDVSEDLKWLDATARMDPRVKPYLNEQASFVMAKPDFSLTGLSKLGTVLTGEYIEFYPGKKSDQATQFSFEAVTEPPAPDTSTPGLHLTLTADSPGSLQQGSPVMLRNFKVGTVQRLKLAEDGSRVDIQVHIDPEYGHLVHRQSRFWQSGGVQLEGGLGGFSLQTPSLMAMVAGGISVDTPEHIESPQPAANGDQFALYNDRHSAHSVGPTLTLQLNDGEGISPRTKLKYRGITIGHVTRVGLTEAMDAVEAELQLMPSAERIARQGSKFWVVKPQLGLSGANNLNTLVSGVFLTVEPGEGDPVYQFTVLAQKPLREESGLSLILTTPRLGSIKPGTPIFYRDFQVGRVTDTELANTADQVLVFIEIDARYAPLARENSQFWNASGIAVDVGLFKGAQIRTQSMQSVLEGGIMFATPDNLERAATTGQVFRLNNQSEPEWLEWSPQIALK